MMGRDKYLLIEALSGIAHCNNFGCTTCGGPFGLKKEFKDTCGISLYTEEFLYEMKELKARDLHRIKFDFKGYNQVAIKSILSQISDEHFREIYNYYSKLSSEDDELAYKLLVWTEFGKRLSQYEKEKLIKDATPTLIKNKYARNYFKKNIKTYNLPLPKALNDIYLEEEKKALRIKKAIKREKLEHDKYIRNIKEMPLMDYIELAKLGKIDFRDGDSKAHGISDDELNGMTLTKIQNLINDDKEGKGYLSYGALDKLYSKRNDIRIEKMNLLREKYKDEKPENILMILLKDMELPIEHYPYELSRSVSEKWFKSLEKKDKIRFVKMLKNTKLKKWRRLLEKDYIRMGIID
jgi:hypothetical protein